MERIGYRTGDLSHKSEDVTQLVDRGTGYFGTGYYFTTTPENCMMQGGAQQRPLFRLTFKDGLNWARGTINLHENLKDLQRYMFLYPLYQDIEKLDKLYKFALRAEDISWHGYIGEALQANWEYEQEEYGPIRWDEYCEKNYELKNLLALADDIPELEDFGFILRSRDRTTGMPDFENITQWQISNPEYFNSGKIYNYKSAARDFKFSLPIEFNLDKDKFNSICADLYEVYKDDYEGGMFRPWKHRDELTGLDSFPTLFMKAMGYDGIWPAPECDNISYGGIIYSKENITGCEKIAEIATEWGK